MRSEDDGEGGEQRDSGNGWGIARDELCPRFARGDNFSDGDGGNGHGDSVSVGHTDGQQPYAWEAFGNRRGGGPA